MGDSVCVSKTTEALDLLRTKAPSHYLNVTQYIGIIECVVLGSGIFAYENPPRYAVGNATRDYSRVWYAGTIVHDPVHSRLYNKYLAAHPGQAVPDDVWVGTGASAEKTSLAVQAVALEQMGAPQSDIDYLRSLENDPQYQNISYSDRW